MDENDPVILNMIQYYLFFSSTYCFKYCYFLTEFFLIETIDNFIDNVFFTNNQYGNTVGQLNRNLIGSTSKQTSRFFISNDFELIFSI